MARVHASRTISITAAPWAVGAAVDLRGFAFRIAAVAICLGCLLFLTATRIETTKERYRLSTLHQQQLVLKTDVDRLRVEHDSLSRPQRIAREAKRLGLVSPGSEQMIRLDE